MQYMYTFLVRLAVTGSTKNEAINKHLFCECGQIATQFFTKKSLNEKLLYTVSFVYYLFIYTSMITMCILCNTNSCIIEFNRKKFLKKNTAF